MFLVPELKVTRVGLKKCNNEYFVLPAYYATLSVCSASLELKVWSFDTDQKKQEVDCFSIDFQSAVVRI